MFLTVLIMPLRIVYYTHKKQKFYLKNKNDLGHGLSYSTPHKSVVTRGNAITQPWSHPIKKM